MQSFLAVYPTVAPPTMTMPMSVSPHSGHQHQISGLLGGVQTTTPNTGTAKTTGTMMNTGTTLMARGSGLANSNTAGTNGTGNGNATAAPLSTGAQNRLMTPGSSSGWSADFAGTSKSGSTDIINMGSTVSLATTMGTATPGLGAGKPTPVATPGPVDPVKASVAHLLTKAYSLPCSTAAQAFTHLVQPMARFQLALDALLPLLDIGAVEVGKMRDAEGLEDVQVQLTEVSRHMRVLSHITDAHP
jgi:hypothetical protein